MADELYIVREGLTSERAESLKRMLAEREVEVYTAPSDDVRGEWSLLAEADVRPRAARFIEQFEEQADDDDDPEQVLDDRHWRQWPRCSACDWPRMTRCDFCGSTGHEFPVADGAPVTETAEVLLVCETCDEPFEPLFLDHCERCNERFNDGVDFPYVAEMDVGNPRVGLMAFGLLVVTALLFGYWWMITR